MEMLHVLHNQFKQDLYVDIQALQALTGKIPGLTVFPAIRVQRVTCNHIR